MNTKKWMKLFWALLLIACCTGIATASPTTEVHVAAIGTDGLTIVDETTVSIEWMEANLPVQGDGVTHYYHQGPVFSDDQEVRWDAQETTNFKDHGAVKGTAITDLCDLVGGMEPGDQVMIRANDGYNVVFDYENVYEYEARQGPIVLCWYNGEESTIGEREGVGYPPDYYTGMRLIFFADTSVNSEGLHIYGNTDMRETMPEEALHLFDNLYPSTNGYTVKWVSDVLVYQGGYAGEGGAPVKSLTEDETETPESDSTQQSPIGLPVILGGAALGVMFALYRRN